MDIYGLPRQALLRRVVLGLGVWLGLSVLVLTQGSALLAWTLPFQSALIEALQPNHVAILTITEEGSLPVIQLSPLTVHDRQLSPRHWVPAQTRLPTLRTDIGHALVPFVVLMTVLISWPAVNPREWMLRVLAALPWSVVMLALTSPVLLAGRLEILLIDAGASVGVTLQQSFLVTLTLFMEIGGRWLIAMVAAIACILLGARLGRRHAAAH